MERDLWLTIGEIFLAVVVLISCLTVADLITDRGQKEFMKESKDIPLIKEAVTASPHNLLFKTQIPLGYNLIQDESRIGLIKEDKKTSKITYPYFQNSLLKGLSEEIKQPKLTKGEYTISIQNE